MLIAVKTFLLVNLGTISQSLFPRYCQFSVENPYAHSSNPLHLTPNLKMFLLHCISQILCTQIFDTVDTELIICAKSFSLKPTR